MSVRAPTSKASSIEELDRTLGGVSTASTVSVGSSRDASEPASAPVSVELSPDGRFERHAKVSQLPLGSILACV